MTTFAQTSAALLLSTGIAITPAAAQRVQVDPQRPMGEAHKSFVLAKLPGGRTQLFSFAGVGAVRGVDRDGETSYAATAQARYSEILSHKVKPECVFFDLKPDTIQNHGRTWRAASEGVAAAGGRLCEASDTVTAADIAKARAKSPHLARAIETTLGFGSK